MRYFFLLLLIALSIGVFVTVIKPRYANIQTIRSDVASTDANLTTADKLQQSRVALIAKYNAIPKADLDSLKTLLPDSVDNIRLIIQVNSLANKNGLSVLRNVDYKSDQDKTTSTPSTIPTPTSTSTTPIPTSSGIGNKPIGEFTITFQTSGQYKNFLTFLSDLEQNLRLVDVMSVDFSVSDTASNPTLASFLTYKVTLKTYWLKQ